MGCCRIFFEVRVEKRYRWFLLTFSDIVSRLFCLQFFFFFSRFGVNYLLACLDRIARWLCGAAINYQHTFNYFRSDGKLTVCFSMFYTKSLAFNGRINLWGTEGVYIAISSCLLIVASTGEYMKAEKLTDKDNCSFPTPPLLQTLVALVHCVKSGVDTFAYCSHTFEIYCPS